MEGPRVKNYFIGLKSLNSSTTSEKGIEKHIGMIAPKIGTKINFVLSSILDIKSPVPTKVKNGTIAIISKLI